MVTLHGKQVVVIGATGLVGSALVEALLALGASVIAGARTRTKLDELRSQHGDHERLRVAEVDATEADGLAALAEDVHQRGGVDGVINASGAFAEGRPWELSSKQLLTLFQSNALANALILRAFVPSMVQRGKGSIVVIAADVVLKPEPAIGAYGASKAAAAHLVETAAASLAGTGVRVNGLFPGTIDAETGLDPLDLCKTCVWLLGEESQAVTGAMLTFDKPSR